MPYTSNHCIVIGAILYFNKFYCLVLKLKKKFHVLHSLVNVPKMNYSNYSFCFPSPSLPLSSLSLPPSLPPSLSLSSLPPSLSPPSLSPLHNSNGSPTFSGKMIVFRKCFCPHMSSQALVHCYVCMSQPSLSLPLINDCICSCSSHYRLKHREDGNKSPKGCYTVLSQGCMFHHPQGFRLVL